MDNYPTNRSQQELNDVVNLEQTYGYNPQQQQEEEKGNDYEWLKILLSHLKEKKKDYIREVV